MLREGDILQGKYRILRKLGQGAEGSVHLALHIQTEQFWAVKEIRGVSSGRRLHELQMMKSLKNSHLPGIIDVLEEDGSTFLVMEYIRGMPLDKPLLRGGTVSAQQAQDILLQTAEALIYLEGRKPPVFHLDIKPANLIRRQDGRIMLVDFGSAGKGCAGRRTGTDGYAK